MAMMKLPFQKIKRSLPILVLCAAAFQLPATAQTAPTTASPAVAEVPVAAPAPSVLSIALPPQSRLRLDLDARDQELLGVVKSFAAGFDGSSLYNLGVGQGNTTAATALPRSGRDWNSEAVVQLLSDVNFKSLLENIQHMRMVVFETPRSNMSAARATANSVIGFYEDAYITREGGRRIARMDMDDVQVLTVGFPKGGFGLVIQAPSMGVVVRSDGYPNLQSVGPLAMAMLLRTVPAAK
jgi:hypothetical protein